MLYYKLKTIFLFMVLLLLHSGCKHHASPSKKSETPSPFSTQSQSVIKYTEKDTINWICIWSDRKSKRQFIEDACREYMFLNQDQHINLRFDEEVDPTYKNLPAMAESLAIQIKQGRSKEDIILFGFAYYIYNQVFDDHNWVSKNLVDFENIPGYKETLAEGIYGNQLFTLNTKGKYIGPFIEGQLSCLYYNQDLAKQMDIEIDQFDLTIEDFYNYMELVEQYNQNTGAKINFILIERIEFFNFLFTTALNYTPEMKQDYTLSQKKEALMTALNTIQKLGSANFSHSTNALDFLDTEKYLFTDGATWSYNKFTAHDSLKASRIVPVEFPSINTPALYSGRYQMHFGVMKNSPQKDKAINLLMFISNTDNAENWVQTTKNPTGIRRHFKADGVSSDHFDTFITHIQNKYKGNLGNIQLRDVFDYHTLIDVDYKAVYNGTKTPQEVFNEIMAQLEIEG